MSKKMLIDATHTEATRVVVLENGRLDELDVDTSTKKQIKGNIYLAKIVRVEPSLQAAFVDYGGNRHGFLAFGEIHPDYYQIPAADKEKLKEMMATVQSEKQEELEEDVVPEDREVDESSAVTDDNEKIEEKDEAHSKVAIENVSDSETEEVAPKRPSFFKRYKIQEVVRQGQVMLIQIVKEERGNKGAALTTYLSLAGRYSVLMPNNGKGGGVSRKITNAKERKEMRAIVDTLPIPQGMSVIVRTAGSGKKKAEIKRDYDYLIKTWMKIRDNTLESMAPKLIHEEGDIIKRSLRDGFAPDIEEILVEGDETFKDTKEFMKILMPNQVKKIKQYKGDLPMFQTYQVENQLEAIHSNIVQLKSGGYIVIDQTEALVSVDVNSGRATKERDIEETALRTNLETCDELARQLKLRDLAGLIVIDFIDMDEAKNNAAIERRLKEALKKDRARIQVGKISGFGLMEMSRQRLHSSFLESSYSVCACCGGKGVVRVVESCTTRALYLLEDAANKNNGNTLVMALPLDVATYVLNQKRVNLSQLEEKYHVIIQILADSTLEKNTDYRLERLRDNGDKVAVQPSHYNNNTNAQKERSDKNNKIQPQPVKKEEQKIPVKEVVAPKEEIKKEGEPVSETPEEAEKSNRRRDRNRRRREWKKNKRLAKRVSTEGQPLESSDVKVQKPSAVSVREEKLPAVVEETHKAVVVMEEKFTVVEQASVADVEKEKAKQPLKKTDTRKGRNRFQSAKTTQEKPAVVTDAVSENIEKESDSIPALSENQKPQKPLRNIRGRSTRKTASTGEQAPKILEVDMQKSVDESDKNALNSENAVKENAKKRGGWWNKLVNN